MKKKLKWIALAIVGVIVIVIIGVWLNLNGIVRRTIETQTASSLDLKTTLGGANVSIFGGSVRLSDLQIGSPPGYSAPQMLTLGGAGVKVSLGQLRGDPVHIQQITIDRPKVVIEANGTKLNFQALMDRPSKSPPEPSSSAPSEPIKVVIDELNVTGAQIALRPGLSLPGLKEEYALTIPSVSLKNVGSGEGAKNGAAIKEVVAELLTTLAAKSAESDQLPAELRNVLKLNVDAVAKQLGGEVNKRLGALTADLEKKLPGDLGKALGGAVDSKDPGKAVEKGLGDLLGGKKKKPATNGN